MITLKNGNVLIGSDLVKKDILIDKEVIVKIDDNINEGEVIDCTNLTILPSFIDCHVHFREPGFEYKATIKEEAKVAAKGGYTDVFMMPNLKPSPSDLESVKVLDELRRDAVINCHILGTITKDEKSEVLSDMDAIKSYVKGFSDDGKGVKTADLMYQAMLNAKRLNRPIIAHSEDESLLYGGVIREGAWNKDHLIPGILDVSETVQLARDLVLAEKTNCQYHLCHISSRYSLELIKWYKKRCNVSCEVTPHHLVLNEMNLVDDGAYKMNPPLSSVEDQKALIEGLKDGSIDIISTDHAPHSNEEKSKGLLKSPFGIVGLETSFPLIYTNFVKTGIISLKRLVDLMSLNESKLFHLDSHEIIEGNKANLTIVDLNKEFIIDDKFILSRSKAIPFMGMKVNGLVKYTILNGGIVYEA
ncbi:MAG: dihydroorotase [Acholeplasmatales bacterium]|nr:dihydroorotase [Acholeplasmatales bacterium]